MSDKTQLQEQQNESTTNNHSLNNPLQGPSNATQMDRMKAIQQINAWLEGQLNQIAATSIMLQQAQANGVLQSVENAWTIYEHNGYLLEMPTTVGRSFNAEPAGVFLPTELAMNIRPFIEMTETVRNANAESSSSGVDWNTRLGIPEYRTQSDNLVAPEASCNVTTLAMILERMGIGRSQVVAALERRMGIERLDSNESRNEEWLDTTLSYLDRQMRAGRKYQRVRGEGMLDSSARRDMAGEYRERAQMEDLLDLLLHKMGQSRTGVVSNPKRLLEEVSHGMPTPTSEQIWNSNWDELAPRVAECLGNGGGAALSFKHKGSTSGGTHIVSILAVQEDAFLIDDPYGDIRDDYNRRGWDDAYWSRNDRDQLIPDRNRSEQRNVMGDTDDWGTSWARELAEEEERGRETTISSTQVARCMYYVQLFHQGNGLGNDTELAPTSSQRPVARNSRLGIK